MSSLISRSIWCCASKCLLLCDSPNSAKHQTTGPSTSPRSPKRLLGKQRRPWNVLSSRKGLQSSRGTPWTESRKCSKWLLEANTSAGWCDVPRAPSLGREVCLETALCGNKHHFTPLPCPQEVQKLTESTGTFPRPPALLLPTSNVRGR